MRRSKVTQRRSHPVWHHDQLLGFADGSRLQLPEDNCAHVLLRRIRAIHCSQPVTTDDTRTGVLVFKYFLQPLSMNECVKTDWKRKPNALWKMQHIVTDFFQINNFKAHYNMWKIHSCQAENRDVFLGNLEIHYFHINRHRYQQADVIIMLMICWWPTA